jgi:hypothetical protein
METRIDVTDRDPDRLDAIRHSLTTLEGVERAEVDAEGSALVVEHDPDVITAGELTAKAGSEGTRVRDEDQQESDAGTAPTDGSEAVEPDDDARPAEKAEGLPRTTTTGDDAQDIRGPGDGAEQDLAALEAERRGELLGHSEWDP